MSKKPLIISHRGRADHELPENTIDACELALKQGASALEVDVRFCRSGELVVYHDLYMRRLTDMSGTLWAKSLPELKSHPLKYNHNNSNLYIPTLKEFIDHFKGTVPINLDAKVFLPIAGQFAKYLVRAIKKSGYRQQFWISSFNPIFLRTVKYCGSDIKTGYLFTDFSYFRRLTERFWYVDYWHPEINMINDEFMKLTQASNKQIYVWTVNEVEDVNRILKYDNLRGIISDKPHLIKRELK